MEAIDLAPPEGPTNSTESTARVRAAQQGDVEAFAALVAEHEAALGRFCGRLLGEAAPAQDLAQETLLRAFQALPHLEDPARFGAWLFGIATNLARLTWRRRDRAPLSLDLLEASAEPLERIEAPWGPPAAPTPEHAYEQAEQARRLLDAIESLPPQLRHSVLLPNVEDFSYAEVAAAMRVPVTTVKGWLFKSRTRLRRTLAGELPTARNSAGRPRRPKDRSRRTHETEARKEIRLMASTPESRADAGAGGQGTSDWWETLGTVAPALFGEGALRVFRAAEEEARSWQHTYIGTEHLLLGMGRDPDGLPATLLGELGAPPAAVRAALAYRLGRGDAPAPPQLGVAARARIALELAREDMRFLKHERIAPEHVLLGLIQVPQGIAALILESMGLSLAQVRTRVLGAIPLDVSSPRSYWRNAGAAPPPERP